MPAPGNQLGVPEQSTTASLGG